MAIEYEIKGRFSLIQMKSVNMIPGFIDSFQLNWILSLFISDRSTCELEDHFDA